MAHVSASACPSYPVCTKSTTYAVPGIPPSFPSPGSSCRRGNLSSCHRAAHTRSSSCSPPASLGSFGGREGLGAGVGGGRRSRDVTVVGGAGDRGGTVVSGRTCNLLAAFPHFLRHLPGDPSPSRSREEEKTINNGNLCRESERLVILWGTH